MKIEKILYVGEETGNSLCRYNAMERLGYDLEIITPRKLLPKSRIISMVFWHLSSAIFTPIINFGLKRFLKNKKGYDLIWVNAGDYLFPSSVKILKNYSKYILNYTTDDPFGGRDGLRHLGYSKSLHLYDLLVVVRPPNLQEAYDLGAKKVMLTYMTADEIEHKAQILEKDVKKKYLYDVLFIGTWFPERGPFMLKLIEKGIPLTIIGSGWHKSKEWNLLKPYIKGTGLYGDDYAKAIQNSKICLGLLSKGNRDEHTTRSMEIPAIGGLLCAERTNEHEALYKDNIEAIFWDSAEECANKCKTLLENDELLNRIAINGQKRFIENKCFNEDMIKSVIEKIKD
jgi:spore maturation protein CgeB